MKRLITFFIFCSLLVAMPTVFHAQNADDNNLEFNLNILESDLNKLNVDLQTYNDIAYCDYAFQEAGNRLKSFAAIIAKDSPLYVNYNNCNLLYYQIQKRIEGLCADYERKQDYDALMNRLQNAIVELSALKEKGEHYVEKSEQDSLVIVKKKANRIYVKAAGEAEAKKEVLESDPALQKLMDSIEESHEEIDALECRSMGPLYEMVFRVIMMVLVLALVVNMMKTKLKAKKMTKDAKKQMNQFMGGDDTPVL